MRFLNLISLFQKQIEKVGFDKLFALGLQKKSIANFFKIF